MSDPDSRLEPGATLDGRYKLAEEIARGGFGLVYRARQLNMDREVAIKMVPPKFMDLPDVVQRFEREARLASRLSHPNTITVHDYGQHEDYLFLVMELLEGEDLADILARQRTVNLERVARISRQVLKSLNEAHQAGIVHRDLKPENIFLTEISGESDFVKVVDFGIAKLAMQEMDDARDTDQRLTVEGNTVGTPTYMSPEQAAGGEVDSRSDLYALGVMMYEMAAGEPPFDSEEPAKLMRQHIFQDIPELPDEQLRESWLQPVVQRAMAKEKEDRYQDASSFIDAIDYAMDASNDERAFAPTQEQSAVKLDEEKVESEGNRAEDSSEFVSPTSDGHSSPNPDSATHSTPSQAPQLAGESSAVEAPSTDQNADASVMTVLEPSPDEDVIVLDESKEAGAASAEARGPEPADSTSPGRGKASTDAAANGLEAESAARSSTADAPSTSEPAKQSAETRVGDRFSSDSSSESDESNDGLDSWSWREDVDSEDFGTDSEPRTGVEVRTGWAPVVAGIVIVLAVAAGLYVYLRGLPPALAP